MSRSVLLRRNSSKQGLETLLRLTTQWSVEDEEEAARERRRRDRDRQLRAQDEDEGAGSPEQPEREALLGPKASETPELDEDEGFGDWAQKPEQRQACGGSAGAEARVEPPRSESPEDSPHQPACESEDSDGHRAKAVLGKLHLSEEGPGPEQAVGGPWAAEQEQQTSWQPRTPSPLVLEETPEPSSPPLSPSTTLADRTECLNRSIKKSNSVKKSQPALPVSKIDERLHQYTQATESAARTPKLSRQASIELPSMAVASTKSRWETGEMQTQSAAKTPSCKDIVAGDMSKKSLWEQRGGCKTSSTVKSTPSGKRYKFVATGHGKYEKVLVDEGSAP